MPLRPLSLLLALLAGAPALADPHDQGPRRDHDAARAALASGEIRPLREVLARVGALVPGDVVAVELEREQGRWVYEVKVIDPDGRRLEVYLDAATGARLTEPED